MDLFIYFVALPQGVNEMVMPCIDGYTVYIDRDLDELGRLKAFWHAMRHIGRADMESEGDVDQIEKEAHGFYYPERSTK